MTPRTHSLLTATTLCACGAAVTGWTGALPQGVGTVALVSLGLVGLALFPHIAPADEPRDRAAADDAGSDASAS